jgi:phosphate transport system permease protein
VPRRLRKLTEKLAEGILALSSSITSITVLLIIVFLFREGLGVFSHSSIEDTHILAVNNSNPVKKLTSAQVKDIFDGKIQTWDRLGGRPDSIKFFRVDNITDYFTEEQIGKDFEYLPQRISEVVQKQPGILAFFPRQYLEKNFPGREVKAEEISAASFLLGKQWFPTAEPSAQLGVLPLILGTLWVSLGAILIALPLGLATAIFMAEIANKRLRGFLKPVVELLAGIPSVVYGFFGLIIVVPAIQQIFHLPVGESGLAGSIILGIMALPTIITISEDALRTTPRALKEASLALGASQWQTITKVTVPFAKSGITAAIILGVGRAIGETMAVLMVTGNAAVIPHSYFEPLRTIPATIAAELGEAPYGGAHFKALFALGCILFIITFCINLIFDFIARKRRLG